MIEIRKTTIQNLTKTWYCIVLLSCLTITLHVLVGGFSLSVGLNPLAQVPSTGISLIISFSLLGIAIGFLFDTV